MKDAVGVWTISYGVTNADKSVTGTTIKKGMKISQATADKWLIDCLNQIYAPKVMKYDSIYHWNQNQFDALMSFCYNIGSIDQLTANGTRGRETIAKKMLEYNKAGGKVLEGLTRRRKAERDLFVTPIKQGYSGKYPSMPLRGYYKRNDGITGHFSYQKNIKRIQKICNWIFKKDISKGEKVRLAEDGMYGKKTEDRVKDLQKKFNLPVNGCYGKLCQKKVKAYKQ